MRALLATCLVAVSCAHHTTTDPYRIRVDVSREIRALGSDDLDVQDEATVKLLAFGADVLPALETALVREEPAVRVGVVEVLDRLRLPEAVPVMIRAAQDPAEDVCYDALQALGTAGDVRGRPSVEAALDDPRPRIRLAAARACATICASEAATRRLVEIAISDQPLPNGTWAVASLRAMLQDDKRGGETRTLVEHLAMPRLEAGRPIEERGRAALLAAALGESASVAPLLEAASNAPDVQLRLQATYALGTVADARAVPSLERLLNGPDHAVAYYVCDALTRMAARGVVGAQDALARYHGARPPRPLPPPGP